MQVGNLQEPLRDRDGDQEHAPERKLSVNDPEFFKQNVHFPPLCFVPHCSLVLGFSVFVGAIIYLCTSGKELLQELPSAANPGEHLSVDEFLKYLSIPLVSTIFTYFHIWAALYMTFYPINYIGCLQIKGTNTGCGWQGIVPSKAEQMARTSVELMTQKIIKVQDVFDRIDPAMVAAELEPVLQVTLTQIIEELASQEEPELWAKLPYAVKNELITRAREDSGAVVEAMMIDVKANIDNVFDLTHMVTSAFVNNPEMLNLMFINCGYNELKFIRDCGAYMGFTFGVVQVTLWIFYSAGWMLPAFGLVVGMVSNWLALKMIFEPVEPVELGCGLPPLQGLFLKRQTQVSASYAKIVANYVLSSKYLMPAVLTGPKSVKLLEVMHKHICDAYDSTFGFSKHAVKMVAGTEKYERCRHLCQERLTAAMPAFGKYLEKQLDAAMDLETLFATKMRELPSKDFEQLLHPVFQEDEWKLVLMGGVLGVVVGCLQWAFLGPG